MDKVEAQRRAHVLAKRVGSGVNAIHEGIWLGLLDRDELQQTTDRYYDAPTSTFLKAEHVASGAYDWEQAALDEHFRGCRTIVVAGAGSGREVAWLLRSGRDAIGFDSTPALVEYGNRWLRSEGLPPRLTLARPDGVPDSLGVYDGAIIGWGALSHVLGSDRRVAFLRALRRHVADRGPLLLSCLWRQAHARRWSIVRGVAAAIRAARRSRDRVELGDVVADAAWHWFTEDELRRELRLGGFELVRNDAPSGGPAIAVAA